MLIIIFTEQGPAAERLLARFGNVFSQNFGLDLENVGSVNSDDRFSTSFLSTTIFGIEYIGKKTTTNSVYSLCLLNMQC